MFPSLYGVVSQGGDNWWEAGGASGAIAVYQPKGAASLGASYTDLSGNGNNATVGIAPTWNATDGWVFNGSSWLESVEFAAGAPVYSVIARFSNVTAHLNAIFALWDSGSYSFGILPAYNTTSVYYINGGGARTSSPALNSGTAALAGEAGYRNGVLDRTLPTGNIGANTTLGIGAQWSASGTSLKMNGKMQAIAVYGNVLTAPQVAAVSAAMAAL